jgi:hypothetical protein
VPLAEPLQTPNWIEYLKKLSVLSGEFQPLASIKETDFHNIQLVNSYTGATEYFSPAGVIYEEWYTQFKKDTKGIKDPTGTLNRFGTSVLKVAMLLSLAEQPILIMSPTAMEQAIAMCEKLVGNIRKITVGKASGSATDAGRKKILLTELMTRDTHEITRTQLHKKFWMHGTTQEWDDAFISLGEAGIVAPIAMGNNVIYKMTDSALEDFRQHFAGKNKK